MNLLLLLLLLQSHAADKMQSKMADFPLVLPHV